jgi:hypothetical protein
MIWHGPTHLQGPVSKDRNWWANSTLEGAVATVSDVADEDEIRLDLVSRVRAEIAAGTYDTPEKWEVALGRLLERLNEE